MNLCIPDGLKSCACCCGLYNVSDGRRDTLLQILELRTDLFRSAGRSIELIDAYREQVQSGTRVRPLDPAIHICEFAGFVDPERRVVGCMLHPSAPGNREVDLRGLCHYGSMACKSFYCPAWTQIPQRFLTIACGLVDDWHLYGLLITDVDFMVSLLGLLELRVDAKLTLAGMRDSRSSEALKSLFSLKSSCPSGASSELRVSRYHFHGTVNNGSKDEDYLMGKLLETVGFTYDCSADEERLFVRERLAMFAETYVRSPSYSE